MSYRTTHARLIRASGTATSDSYLKKGEIMATRDALRAYLRGETKRPTRALRSPE